VEDHPTAQDFRSLLQQSPQPRNAERNALAVRHLLSGCEVCRSMLQQLRGVQTASARMFDLPLPAAGEPHDQPGQPYNYDWAFARASRTLNHHLAQGQVPKHLPDRLAEFSNLSEGEQIRRVSSSQRFAHPEFIRYLIDRSDAARYQNSRNTLHFAQLAHLAAEVCTSELAGGEKCLADLRAHSWGALGNAQRICSDFMEAERSFIKAFQEWDKGSGSPTLRAFLLARRCALRNCQGLLEEASALSSEQEQICREIGDPHLLAIAQIQKAITFIYTGETETAAGILQQTVLLIDSEAEPYLFLAAYHNLSRCYVDLDRPDEAIAVHYEIREFYQTCKAPLILLRATWQEGQLLRGIGHSNNAEAALLRACKGFEEEGLAYEMAGVCLDLADLYWELRLFDKLRGILTKAVPIFRSLRMSQEVLASLLRLQQAAERESAGAD
jgi:tetratricopeptide (TPR) repeat protein